MGRNGRIYLFCFLLVSGLAQPVPPGGANRRMTLDVVVTDKSGKPVSGLRQRDFTLLDNKQPRKILSFHAVEGGTATADSPVEVILLMDAVNTAFTNVAAERNEIERFLRRNGGALAQPLSIIFLSDSGTTQTTPSRDGNAVMADLNQKQLGLRSLGRSQGEYGDAERTQVSLNALQELIDYEVATPGRKLVVWISPGWPFVTSDSQRQALSDGMRQARITLYNIDPLGLADASQFRTTDLQALASQTGGRVFNSNNDVAGEIATCVADANVFYVLSFDPLAGDGSDQRHSLEIKIGKRGLTARMQSGYYAETEPHRP
jgi:VWFA-related protein